MAEALSLVLISQSLPSDTVSERIQRVLDGLECALTRQADQMFPPVIELPRCEAERTGYLRSLLRLQQEGQDVIGDLVDELDLRLAAAPEEEMPKCRP